MKFCIKCGKELNDEFQFCPYCSTDQTPSSGSEEPMNQAVKMQIKRWPLFVGGGIGLVLIAVLVLLLTGVINLGSPAPNFTNNELNGDWSGEITLDAVNGTSSEAKEMRQYIGDSRSIDMELYLNIEGVGTATVDYDDVSARLSGSTLDLEGAIDTVEIFTATGNITKTGSKYTFDGTYTLTEGETNIQGKINLVLEDPDN